MDDHRAQHAHVVVDSDGKPTRLVEPGAVIPGVVAGIYNVVEYAPVTNELRERLEAAEAALQAPLRETILAVLRDMPAEAAPEHLAQQIESQVWAWQHAVWAKKIVGVA